MSRRIIEALVVVSVLVIVANVAIPVLAYVELRARAVRIVNDVRNIRDVAADFHRETGSWPAEVSSGRVRPTSGRGSEKPSPSNSAASPTTGKTGSGMTIRAVTRVVGSASA